MIPEQEVNAKIDKAFDNIIKACVNWTPVKENAPEQSAPYPAKTFKFTGTYTDVNALYIQRGWSLSLPIVPPTVERVQEMLKGTKRDPGEVLWVVPPREGILTVELVAALGVMAGSKPEHMPLLLAAVEAMADPRSTFRGPTTTTAAAVPVFFISGPIIEKLKLNAGTGTAGSENPVTNALGYFVNLVADVVGGSADLVAMVFSENVAGSVWKSYPETIGFNKDDSVVTFFGAYPGGANVDHGAKTGQRLLTTIGAGILGTASAASSCFADADEGDSLTNKTPFVFVVLGPEHASLIASSFPDRNKAKDFLREVTAMPYKFYGDGLCIPPEEFGSYDENTLIPRYKKSKSIEFFISGGPGKQSQMWIPLPRSVAVSKKVME